MKTSFWKNHTGLGSRWLFWMLCPVLALGSYSCEEAEKVRQILASITDGDRTEGLRSLLKVSTDTSVSVLSRTNGYFADQAVKLLLPPEAQQLAQFAGQLGLQSQVDDFVLRMNRAAEAAATRATPIFTDAITNISFSDAAGIIAGTDTAATQYLRGQTYTRLGNEFRPEVQTVLGQPLVGSVSAADSWTSITGTYNTFANSVAGQLAGANPINTDLTAYVTDRALSGLFVKLRGHEQRIRQNPALRVTEQIRKIFPG